MGELSDFGNYLREKRAAKRFGLREAARRIHISPSYLCDIENGLRRPAPAVLARLASELGEDFDALRLRAGIVPDDVLRQLKAHPERLAKVRALLE